MSQFFPPDENNHDPETEEPAEDAGVERVERKRQRRRVHAVGIAFGSLALVLVLGMVGAAVYLGSINHSISENLHRSAGMPSDTPTTAGEAPRPKKQAGSTALNYVLMGSDSRDPGDVDAGRSDVLMVLHLDADRHAAEVISFPRDMYVPIPGHGENKINAAFAFGGTSLTIRTLEGMLDTRMDHFAVIDFDGFIQLTDELGGVTVDNPHYSLSQGYKFPVGKITVKGEQALAYVRERHQLPRGDLDRSERQRLVVQAIIRKGLSADVISNPVTFDRFVSHFAQQVTVDDGLEMSEIRRTALSIRFSPSDVASVQAPISGFGTTSDGQSIDVVNQKKLNELGAALRNDTMQNYMKKYPNG